MKKKESKHVYQLELTERQAKLLSYACDRLSRIICGQDWTYQEFFEEAWEKRCKVEFDVATACGMDVFFSAVDKKGSERLVEVRYS